MSVKGSDGQVCDARSVQSTDCLLPSFVCRLGCFLNIQLRRCLLNTVKRAEVGGGSCLDHLREACLQDLLREKVCSDCVSDPSLDARFGCDESSQVCRSSDVSRSFLLCEAREEPFKRLLLKLLADLCSTLLLKQCVAVNPQNVVDTANSQTLSEDGELRLRVLAELDAFVPLLG